MTKQPPEGTPRYSLKTLQACHDGATEGRAAAKGELRLTITDDHHHTYQATVLSIGTQIHVQLDNGTVLTDIKPAWVTYAEVV